MGSKYYTFIFVIMVLPYLSVQSKEGCYNIPVYENFDYKKLEGAWYTQEIGGDTESFEKCLVLILTIENIGSDVIIHNQLSFKSDTKEVDMYQVNNTSEYTVEWLDKLRSGWCVASDNETYSIWYTCIPEHKDKGIFLLGTKSQHVTEATLKQMHDTLKKMKLNFPNKYLRIVDRKEC